MRKFAAFKLRYPDIDLDIDCSDRLVDVIEEGFDAVIRTGNPADSRLMTREIGSYRRVIVGSPAYFQRAGTPQTPEDLAQHTCMLYRYPSSGKLDIWPLESTPLLNAKLPSSIVTNTLEPLIVFAEQGLGIACIPNIAISPN